MVGPEARRVREGRIRFPASAQSRIGSSRSGPCLNALGFKGGHLLEALEGLRRAIVTQEDLALHEPWFRVIPSKGDRAVVVLDRRTPTAFPLEELAFSEKDGRVLRVLSERARELGFGGIRISEVDERVPEAEDGPRVVRSNLEDCAKQLDGVFRMSIPPELFRSRNFTVTNISTFLIYGALYVVGIFLTLFIQGTIGFTAAGAGFGFIPSGLFLVFLSSRFGALAARYGPRRFMAIGPAIMTLAVLWYVRIPATTSPWLFAPKDPTTWVPPSSTATRARCSAW